MDENNIENKKINITVIGAGYVGLVASACLADMGNRVICVDCNKEKINLLNKGIIPLYEPGLEELVKTNIEAKRLSYSDDINYAVKNSLICIIAVGTPPKEDGSVDLSYVFKAAKDIACVMDGYRVIVDKSTVPVGTSSKIAQIIKENTNFDFDVVSNPEFLKQGNAIDDFLSPDRVIIGVDSKKALKIMQELYSPYFRKENRIIIMDIKSAEMTKYASNAFLATKISFINEIALLCEKTGADVEMVRRGMGADSRIGNQFLFPGLGYGGSCFPKDVRALIKTGEENNCETELLRAVEEVNKKQRYKFIDKILKRFNNDIKDKTFALWGLSFKPKTSDLREAPSITIINELLKKGAKIKAYDPKAMQSAKLIFEDKIEYSKTSYDALSGSDALILITEWSEFRRIDINKIKNSLKTPLIFDGRNQYNPKEMKRSGIEYICTGKC